MSSLNQLSSLNAWFPPRPAGSPVLKPLRAIGLIGSGNISTGIAHWCATKCLGIIMHDPEAGRLSLGVEVVRGLFRAAEERNEISHAAAHKAMGGIGITTSMDDMEFCDMVIETLFEDAALHQARFASLARVMPKEAVLATCADEAELEELTSGITEPGRVIGLRFTDPVGSSLQVQITLGAQTSRETAERVMAFVATLDKTPVVSGQARPGT